MEFLGEHVWVVGGDSFLSTLKLWSLINIQVAKKCNDDVHAHIHIKLTSG